LNKNAGRPNNFLPPVPALEYVFPVQPVSQPNIDPMKKLLRKLLALGFAAALLATPAVVSAQSDSSPAPAKTEKKQRERGPAKVDINTATKDALAKLPGIDEATADKIIAARPFTNKTQLKTKKIISEATYDGIKDLTVARQPKDPNAPKKEGKKKKKAE
jgi:hypothetical protein